MSSDALIGRTIGNYDILDRLGKGGMAVVYRARQVTMQRDVALKVMSSDLADDPQFVARFEREAQVIANLQHPRILPVHDFGHEGDIFYLVMRVIEGSTLYYRLTDGPMPLLTVGRFVNQIAEALDYAHSQGVVHRDLKPNNILIDELDNLYLMDFGLAKMLASSTHLTATGAVLGTPAYMAPEQWRGEAVDARSDVYSLGVILYEMVTGRAPFESDTPFTLMYKHINDAPPNPRDFVPDLPEPIEAVILRALAKDKASRYPSAGDLARDFTATLQGCAIQGCEALTPPMTPVILRGEARPESDPALPPVEPPPLQESTAPSGVNTALLFDGAAPDSVAPPDSALIDSVAPPDSIAPPPPSVPVIPVAGRDAPPRPKAPDALPAPSRITPPRAGMAPVVRKAKPDSGPPAPVREFVERLQGSTVWQNALEAVERGLETALEHAAEAAPLAEEARYPETAQAALLHDSTAFAHMRDVLRPGESLVGVLDVRGTPEWRLWQGVVIGGLVANVLGGIAGAGLLSTLGVLAWVFVFVQAVRTWRGSIGRYFLGFTSERLILLPRDADGAPQLDDAQAASWPVIDRFRLTGRYVMLDVPNPDGRDFHFAALVLAQGEGGLGAQYDWLPGSPIVGLLAEQGFNVAEDLA